jgi:hypothetical protein
VQLKCWGNVDEATLIHSEVQLMPSGHGEKITRRMELAVAALLTEPTVEAAARQAKVSHHTLKNWLRRPDFQATFRAAKRAIVEDAVARLQQTALRAVQSLTRNLDCTQPAVEVSAAKAVLEYTFKGVEFLNLLQEIEVLKRQIEELTNRSVCPVPSGYATPPPPEPIDHGAELLAGPSAGRPGGDLPGSRDDPGPLADTPPLFPGTGGPGLC